MAKYPHKVGQKVKLTKVSSIEGRPSGYEDGYWIIGELMTPIAIGKSVVILRKENPKGKIFGTFNTSAVQAFEGVEDKVSIRTSNSNYLIEYSS
jgi:hypothetical protein